MGDPARITLVGSNRASRSTMQIRRSAWASSITPPSEVIRPPKAALTFLLATVAGRRAEGYPHPSGFAAPRALCACCFDHGIMPNILVSDYIVARTGQVIG
jgi:hypothetical protein